MELLVVYTSDRLRRNQAKLRAQPSFGHGRGNEWTAENAAACASDHRGLTTMRTLTVTALHIPPARKLAED